MSRHLLTAESCPASVHLPSGNLHLVLFHSLTAARYPAFHYSPVVPLPAHHLRRLHTARIRLRGLRLPRF